MKEDAGKLSLKPFDNKTIPNPNNTSGIVLVWFSSMIPVAIRRHPSFLVNFRLYFQIHTDGLLGTYISPTSGHFPVWWDMLIPYSVYIWSNYSDLTPQQVAAEGKIPLFQSIKNWMGPIPNGPLSVSCDRAIRYSGYLRVRSVGPTVGDFLDSGKSGLVKYYKLARYIHKDLSFHRTGWSL